MDMIGERLDARDRPAEFYAALGEGAFPPWLIYADPATDIWWERVRSFFPEYQIVLMDADEPIAAGWAVPIAWDGTLADLPTGYTATLQRAVEGHEAAVEPNALVVCAAVVLPQHARRGLAGVLLSTIRDLPSAQHLAHVIAPVRPTSKAFYPLIPIDAFAAWTRTDGLPLDPWLRTHIRIGGSFLTTAPASQTLQAPVEQWEQWADLAMPSSGQFVICGGLHPLQVDRDQDRGVMVEPNIWVQHR